MFYNFAKRNKELREHKQCKEKEQCVSENLSNRIIWERTQKTTKKDQPYEYQR